MLFRPGDKHHRLDGGLLVVIRHHRQIGALLAADPIWCTQKLGPPPASPFPFWLDSESPFKYSLNERCFGLDCEREVVPTAIGDYEAGWTRAFRPDAPNNFSPAATQATSPK